MDATLKQLLVVEPSDITGVLQEFTTATVASHVCGNPVAFYFVRFMGGKPRLDDLMKKLRDLLIAYCLPRERHKTLTLKTAQSLLDEAKATFNKPKKLSTSGEFGELMVYFLLEGCIGAPQIVSKMSLKTSGNSNLHGSDGIHLGYRSGALTFFFAEAKVHKNVKTAVASAIASVLSFNLEKDEDNKTQHEFEATLTRNHLDIPPGPLREHVLSLLDPYSPTRDQYAHVNACFIGFDWDKLAGKVDDKSSAWTSACQTLAQELIKLLEDKFSDAKVSDFAWHFFFVPFEDVDKARETFMKGVKQA